MPSGRRLLAWPGVSQLVPGAPSCSRTASSGLAHLHCHPVVMPSLPRVGSASWYLLLVPKTKCLLMGAQICSISLFREGQADSHCYQFWTLAGWPERGEPEMDSQLPASGAHWARESGACTPALAFLWLPCA
jgi:hypothetical protein